MHQPLDVSIFGPMKKAWRNILQEEAVNRKEPTLPKSEFPQLLTKLVQNFGDICEQNLKSGFKSCGIHPLDKYQVLRKLTGYKEDDSDVSGVPSHVVTESYHL